ncbi:PREDICTED: UBX domain-containing protein 1-A-like isoform X2 [Priapulus caudatus]|uniref:UBX domain-containing protein 1-A-like isoform X2 n=1 Tax=Priapulus caudatus TaxID=37621 RepID=A0ABM1DPG8_PRICU|nr:PREDICTED: UBX domain-containing protein 1-A-like isoform X2 [Priapulus caudatus]
MASTLNMLMEMGFQRNKAEKAITVTNNQGVEAAMEWLLAHNDDPDIDMECQAALGQASLKLRHEPEAAMESTMATDDVSTDTGAATAEVEDGASSAAVKEDKAEEEADDAPVALTNVKSLKCDECNRNFRREIDVEAHAVKTGHSSFSESTEEVKPLTEEEKQQQMQKVQEKIKERREQREEKERKEKLDKEMQRRRTGKEMVESKNRIQEQEMKKMAEERKKEKMEEKAARLRVKNQIEKDKLARKQKFQFGDSAPAPPAPVAADPPPVTQPHPKKEYDKCKLQIRLVGGKSLIQEFGAKEQLAAVRLFVQMRLPDQAEPFTFMTTFPKHIFTEEEMEVPLCELGLVPTSVLLVTKP